MVKKDLERLRPLNATPAMIKALDEPGKEKIVWINRTYEHRYNVAARCQNLQGILKVSVCTREDISDKVFAPKWDIFINPEGDEYITRERQADGSYKWRGAYINNLANRNWHARDYDKYMYINPEGRRSIQRLLGTKEGGFEGILEWQTGCKKRQEDAKIKRLTDKWDEDMKPVKDPPAGFEEWWHHNAFDGSNHIFYASKDATEGFCTSCLDMVKMPGRPRHNAAARCPVCRKSVTLISRAKKTTGMWTYWKDVSCVQRYRGGLVHRIFLVRRCDKKVSSMSNLCGVNRSVFTVEETRRTLILEDGYKVFEYGDYRRRGRRWYERKDEPIEKHSERMYPRNLTRLLKNSHTSYLIAAKHKYQGGGILYFLTTEKRLPVIEMAYKAGLYELAHEMVDKSWVVAQLIFPGKKELAKILGIDRARMRRLKQMQGGLNALIWLQREKQMDTILRDADIMTLAAANLQPETLERAEVPKYLSLEKICNYLNKQAGIRPGGGGGRIHLQKAWLDWNDYIRMMEKMKMDCSNEQLLKPKDLTIAHNELVARISMKDSRKEIAKKEKKYKAAQELMESGALRKYEYSDERYCIVAPTGIADIYSEGLALKHCIHTCEIYFQRIDIRETYLLFLRRKEAPDRPWYTLEVEPGGNIRQKKSVLNEAYKDLDDALPFLKEWQQWVKENLSEEDKKLAEKSGQARKDGYEKLREEKKIVWHGSLRGTLLADALEDDFMEAL